MSELPSRVIFLNRTSSSGKTTLARAIQDESDIPFVYRGIDTLFGSVPPNWGGGRDGPLSRDESADLPCMITNRAGQVGIAGGFHGYDAVGGEGDLTVSVI